jgi:hypothetical protein
LHPKAIVEKADEHFPFIGVLTGILKYPFRADPPKDRGTYFLVPIAWYFFRKILLAPRKTLGQSIFRKLFILFTEIASVPTLHPPLAQSGLGGSDKGAL